MNAIETDLKKIENLSKQKENEFWEFRAFLKGCDMPSEEIDTIVHDLYKNISSQIDCKTCANCCKEIQPVLDQEDIEKFSKGLGMPISRFSGLYLIKAEETCKFMFNKKPCPFLKNNLCTSYDYNPKDCMSYPHLYKDGFVFRLINVIENCSVCPIVFNVYKFLKHRIRNVSFH